ncbi:MAG: monovalent cation/H+ antiporter subunit D family protein [Candidatus Rokubacteria bacterium]|nr:monovalent cation/H+ antiporter subunit D family protein [Betaproteobacteria bacterium]MBM4441095.1 monovalent cation/H+ antiporter subunit D family protein [Candidatus Rokubacteria bacterium]
MITQLPILQVVIPLIAAPLMVLLRHGTAAWLLAVGVSWASLAIALGLLSEVAGGGLVSYALGSWPPPWGIEYRVDSVNAYLAVIVSMVAAVVVVYMRRSVAEEVPQEHHYLFYSMYALCLAGLLGIALTGDGFNMFVFFEISSLATYVLIALGRDRRALMAAYQYLIMGTIGATFFVIGVGLLYLMTGTLNLADMAARLPDVTDPRPVLAALAFITVGVSLKLALFPLHLWLPNAYAYAPSAVTAFLAATATKVSVYVLLRFYFSVFGETAVFRALPTGSILLALSLAAVFVASVVAIFQGNVKRMFAYSSVAQIGYITLGVSFDSATGLTAGIVHLFNHALTKGALFLLLGGIALRAAAMRFDDLRGMGRLMPLTSFGIVLGGLSLIGVPGTVGFVSKWYLVVAALEQGAWWIAFLVVAGSLLALAYVWRFVEAAYFHAPDPKMAAGPGEAPLSMLVPAWLMIAACVYFGLDTGLTLGGAGEAAQVLLKGKW